MTQPADAPDASDLSLDRIKLATRAIDPVFLHSPQFTDGQLSAALGREVVVKLETDNPLHSFKGRGADFLVRQLDPAQVVVCHTAGNFGQAMAYAGRSAGIGVEVFVDERINPAKLNRIRALDARVTVVPGNASDAAREHAARHDDRVYVVDGREPAVAEGAGTIGVELLDGPGHGGPDTVVLPVGDGALINGVARWIKAHTPDTRVIGVCVTGAPAMAHAWRTGTVVDGAVDTIAAGISIRTPVPESVRRMRALVDDIVLVDDDALLRAMRLAAETLGTLLEPAGAASLAAIAEHDLPGERLAAVLSGGNPNPALLRELFA